MMRLCHNCKHFKQNKPNTPIFINGLWWGGGDAGLCKKWNQDYNTNQHRVDTDGCSEWQAKEEKTKVVNCPKCGRFMSKTPEVEEWVIEHTHDTEDRIGLTHSHPIFTETWKCELCDTIDKVEVEREYHNTLQNPEPW
jgi:hypothetical protein